MPALTTIKSETVARCAPADLERLATSPAAWALWPGVFAVEPSSKGQFLLKQSLELPFFGVAEHQFCVCIDGTDWDGDVFALRWHTTDWQFARRGTWHAQLLRTRTRVTLTCDDELEASDFERARNAYRATSIWPMRHGHNEVLTLLTLDFLRDKLVADDNSFVKATRRWLQREVRG